MEKCDCGEDKNQRKTLMYTALGFGAILIIAYVAAKKVFKKGTPVTPMAM